MIFKKTAVSWKDLFWFTLDYLADSDDEFLKNTSTNAFTISFEACFSHWKNGKMKTDLGDIFKRPSAGELSPGVEFISKELFVWDFSSLYGYLKCPCCSPWPELKKEARRSKKNTANRSLWLEFAKHVQERCIKCQLRLDKIQNPEE